MPNALQRAAYQNPYDEEQDNPSLWKRLGNTALSGVAALGNFLDTPSSMLRDVVGLENPFDNLINPFSSERRLSGRDLLRKYGLVGQQDTYGNFAAGLGAEIASSFAVPGLGSLLTGAKGAGAGAKGLLKFSAPGIGSTEVLTSPAAQKFASGLGTAAEATYKPSVLAPLLEQAATKIPGVTGGNALTEAAQTAADALTLPVRSARGLFDATARGKFTEYGQDLAGAQHAKLPEAVRAARETVVPWIDDFNDLQKSFTETHGEDLLKTLPKEMADKTANVEHHLRNKFESFINHAGETDIGDAFSQLGLNAAKATPDFTKKTNSLIDAIKSANKSSYSDYLEMGGAGKVLEDLEAAGEGVSGMNYLPRAAAYSFNGLKSLLAGISTRPAHSLARDEAARYVPKLILEQLAHDDIARGILPDDLKAAFKASGVPEEQFTAHAIEQKYGKYLNKETVAAVDKNGKPIQVPKWNPTGDTPLAHASELATWAKKRQPYQVYQNDLLGVEGRYHNAVNIARSNLAAIHDMVVKHAGPMDIAKETIEGTPKQIIPPEWNITTEVGGQPFVGKRFNPDVHWGDDLSDHWIDAPEAGVDVPTKVHSTQGTTISVTMPDGSVRAVDKRLVGNIFSPPDAVMQTVPGEARTSLRGTRDFTQSTRGQNLVPLPDVYKLAGMDVDKSLKYVAQKMGHSAADIADPEKWKALKSELSLHGVPEDISEAIHAARKVPNNPEWLDHIKAIADLPTGWFKQNVTLPFASFASRNALSGQYMNAAGGDIKNIADLQQYGGLVKQHFDDWKAGKITPEMEREWFTNGVLSGDTHFEGVQFRNPEFGKVLPDNPLNVKKSILEAGQDIAPSELDKVPGLHAVRQAHGAVLTTGAKANGLVEFLNRVPMYEYLKAKGMSPQDAAKRVLELQVDYAPHAFSPFENEVARRLVPFFAYQRRIAPVILKTLARNPAGTMGQTIRASRLAASDDPTTPPWLADTLAIPSPFGSREEGGKAYITGMGLPYEPVAGYLGGGLRGAGRNLLSQLNPILKAPLEWSVGSSFFQSAADGSGRPLDELNPPIGQTLANAASVFGRDASKPVDLPDGLEFLAANSPASRLISTARSLTDPRKPLADKALNALTGVRIAEVSPAASDTALFNRVASTLKSQGARTFSETYLPKDQIENMPKGQREMVEQLITLKKQIESRRKQRKKNALELAAAK